MKKLLLSLLLLLVSVYSYSQERKMLIGFSYGAANPIGKGTFTMDDYGYSVGFAKPGYSFNVNFHYRLNNWFGLSASLIKTSNDINTANLGEITFPGHYASEIGQKVNKPTSNGCLLIGAFIKKSGFPLYGKIQVGYGFVQAADVTFVLKDNNGTPTGFTMQSDAPFGFAYSAGIGAIFPVYKKLALTISVDFVSCLATPNVVLMNERTAAPVGFNTYDYSSYSINSQLGIAYMFK